MVDTTGLMNAMSGTTATPAPTGNAFRDRINTSLGKVNTAIAGSKLADLPLFQRMMDAGQRVNAQFDKKGKGGAMSPSQMQVPATNTPFFQPMNRDARSALLQAMMQRSRGGGTPPVAGA